jgi:hypothetical protein
MHLYSFFFSSWQSKKESAAKAALSQKLSVDNQS